MGMFADRLNTMLVKVSSPDDTVRLYLTGGGQLHLEFASGSLERHSESSLSTQLSHVCTVALRRKARGMATVVRQVLDEVDVDEDDTFTGGAPAPPGRKTAVRRRLGEAAAGITAVGRSPRACVTARRIPGDIMDIKLRKGTLQRWSSEEVAVECYGALAAVAADHRRQLTELRRTILESAPDTGKDT